MEAWVKNSGVWSVKHVAFPGDNIIPIRVNKFGDLYLGLDVGKFLTKVDDKLIETDYPCFVGVDELDGVFDAMGRYGKCFWIPGVPLIDGGFNKFVHVPGYDGRGGVLSLDDSCSWWTVCGTVGGVRLFCPTSPGSVELVNRRLVEEARKFAKLSGGATVDIESFVGALRVLLGELGLDFISVCFPLPVRSIVKAHMVFFGRSVTVERLKSLLPQWEFMGRVNGEFLVASGVMVDEDAKYFGGLF